MIEMSETKESYGETAITVTINFDHLPDHVGNVSKGRRWYRPEEDTNKILSYVRKQIGAEWTARLENVKCKMGTTI